MGATPRMIPVQSDPGSYNPNPNLIATPRPPPSRGSKKAVVFGVLGVAAIGGTVAVVVSRRQKAHDDTPKELPTETAKAEIENRPEPKNKKKKPPPDDEYAKVVDPKPIENQSTDAGSAAGSGSGSSRPPPIPGLQVEIDGTDVGEALRDLKPEIAKCKSLYKTVIKITVTVNPDGSVKSATLKDTPEVRENPDPALAKCVIRHVSRAKFKKTQLGGTFDYPFLF